MWFKLKTNEPFVFAGLSDAWTQPDGRLLRTYTVVTTEPNEVLAPIHNRMPAMLSDRDALEWVGADGGEIDRAQRLLKPFPAALRVGYDVSKRVNKPLNDSPECIAPVDA